MRRTGGGTAILDEDEFEEHSAAFGYPDGVVARARATAGELFAAIDARREPFGEAGPGWLARYRERFAP